VFHNLLERPLPPEFMRSTDIPHLISLQPAGELQSACECLHVLHGVSCYHIMIEVWVSTTHELHYIVLTVPYSANKKSQFDSICH
jgi:hypothetical protein